MRHHLDISKNGGPNTIWLYEETKRTKSLIASDRRICNDWEKCQKLHLLKKSQNVTFHGYTSKIIFSEWIKKMKEQHQISKVRRCTTTTHKGFYLELHSPVKSTGGERDRPNQRIFLDHLDRKMSHMAWSWRGVICGETWGSGKRSLY